MDAPQAAGPVGLVELLGVGKFGKVYLAWDHKLGRDVAIEIPREA